MRKTIPILLWITFIRNTYTQRVKNFPWIEEVMCVIHIFGYSTLGIQVQNPKLNLNVEALSCINKNWSQCFNQILNLSTSLIMIGLATLDSSAACTTIAWPVVIKPIDEIKFWCIDINVYFCSLLCWVPPYLNCVLNFMLWYLKYIEILVAKNRAPLFRAQLGPCPAPNFRWARITTPEPYPRPSIFSNLLGVLA